MFVVAELTPCAATCNINIIYEAERQEWLTSTMETGDTMHFRRLTEYAIWTEIRSGIDTIET